MYLSFVFEFVKGVYFLLSILIWIFFLRGFLIFKDGEIFILIWKILLPAYLFFTGLMIGYVISYIWIVKDNLLPWPAQKKAYLIWFGLWTIFGIWMAVFYIFNNLTNV